MGVLSERVRTVIENGLDSLSTTTFTLSKVRVKYELSFV